MKIAVIGWGSLLWDPRNLKAKSGWHDDGPELPVEYLRQSSDGRLTLVIREGCIPQKPYWALSSFKDLESAVENLRKREGTAGEHIHYTIRNEPYDLDNARVGEIVQEWLADKPDLVAAIWTGLRPKFKDEEGRAPTPDEALEYFRSLEGVARNQAEEYIRKTPVQIRTVIRERVERELGWTPDSDRGA